MLTELPIEHATAEASFGTRRSPRPSIVRMDWFADRTIGRGSSRPPMNPVRSATRSAETVCGLRAIAARTPKPVRISASSSTACGIRPAGGRIPETRKASGISARVRTMTMERTSEECRIAVVPGGVPRGRRVITAISARVRIPALCPMRGLGVTSNPR